MRIFALPLALCTLTACAEASPPAAAPDLDAIRDTAMAALQEARALKEQALKREKQGRHGEAASPRTPLGFYDALTDKKEEARLRSKTKEASSRSRAQLEPPVKVESKTQRKVFAKPQPSSDKEGPAAGPCQPGRRSRCRYGAQRSVELPGDHLSRGDRRHGD